MIKLLSIWFVCENTGSMCTKWMVTILREQLEQTPLPSPSSISSCLPLLFPTFPSIPHSPLVPYPPLPRRNSLQCHRIIEINEIELHRCINSLHDIPPAYFVRLKIFYQFTVNAACFACSHALCRFTAFKLVTFAKFNLDFTNANTIMRRTV